MKVLHIITDLGRGGAESVLLDLVEELGTLDIENEIATLRGNTDLLEERGVLDYRVYKGDLKKTGRSLIKTYFHLKKRIGNGKYDLLHLHLVHPAIVVGIMKLFGLKIPVVFTPHTSNVEGWFREMLLFFTKGMRKRDILFYKNQRAYYHARNFELIPNGIKNGEHDRACKFDNADFTILMIGRLESVKNFHRFPEILSRCKHPNISAIIIGEGPMRTQIERSISEEGMTNRIQLLGYKGDVQNYYKTADLFLLLSEYEGMPLVLLEAGLSGTPILATRVGIVPDVLLEQFGYIASLEDFPEWIDNIVENYDIAKEKAKDFQKNVLENFTMRNMAKKHLALYRSVLEEVQ